MNFIFGDTIDFTRLTWEAFATFLTGIAAVGGAIAIGIRQTDIQRRQVELQQLELRRLLFDQRMPVYEATVAWITHILATGNIPARQLAEQSYIRNNQDAAENARQAAIEREFVEAIERSRFVFSPHVFEALERLWINGNELHYYKVAKPQDDAARKRNIDEAMRLHSWFAEQLTLLQAVFGDELKVSDGGDATYRPLATARKVN